MAVRSEVDHGSFGRASAFCPLSLHAKPKLKNPVADLIGDAELSHFLDTIRQKVDRTCQQLPRHQAYVQQYCAAGEPAR